MTEVLGKHLANKYLQSKKQEWVAYTRQVSEWEIDQYLEQV